MNCTQKAYEVTCRTGKGWKEYAGENNPCFVLGQDPSERVEEAIRVPDEVTTPDGRVIKITGWRPNVAVDEIVSVQLCGFIELPRGDK